MSKFYKFGDWIVIASECDYYEPIKSFRGGVFVDMQNCPSGEFIEIARVNGYAPSGNNYQDKPKCSQPDSHLSSCHASETTAKSSGLLSRICSLFSSNAKK